MIHQRRHRRLRSQPCLRCWNAWEDLLPQLFLDPHNLRTSVASFCRVPLLKVFQETIEKSTRICETSTPVPSSDSSQRPSEGRSAKEGSQTRQQGPGAGDGG